MLLDSFACKLPLHGQTQIDDEGTVSGIIDRAGQNSDSGPRGPSVLARWRRGEEEI